MRAIVCGANGAMGKLICGNLGDEVVGRVSIDGENGVPKTFAELGKVEADVLIDFSHHTAIGDVLAYAKEIGCAAVIGTTGHTPEEKEMIYAAAEEIPVFFTGNMSQMVEIMNLCGDKIDVYSGEDALTVPMMAMDGAGTISVLSNILPAEAVAMTDACKAGDFKTAAAMQCKFLPLINALFSQVNPIPVKAAAAALGFGDDALRMPLTPMEEPFRTNLFEEMRKLGMKV